MPIMAFFTGSFSREQYDMLRKEVDWEGNNPPGVLLHAASFDDAGGAHVVDIWESPEKMNAFVTTRLMPAFQKLGFAPPNVEVFPAHNINAYPAIDKYKP